MAKEKLGKNGLIILWKKIYESINNIIRKEIDRNGFNDVAGGKNIFKFREFNNYSIDGLTFTTLDNNNLLINGTVGDKNIIIAVGDATVKSGKTYIGSSSHGSLKWDFHNIYDGTITATEDRDEQIAIRFDAGSTYSNEKVTIQVEEGDTNTIYEPFFKSNLQLTDDVKAIPDMQYDIILNRQTLGYTKKNLINVANASKTANAYYWEVATGFAPENGETYTLSFDATCDVYPCKMSIGKGTYQTFSDMYTKQVSQNGRVSFTFTWNIIDADIEKGWTNLFFRFPRYDTSTAFNATISNIQLEVGDTATAYEPYIESVWERLSNIEDSGTNDYTHPNSGVTAGTYRNVTVNAQGHVTAGSNPTITVAQGGTGQTTARGAEYNITSGMIEVTTEVTDDSQFAGTYQSPSTTQGRLYWRKATTLWNYIKSKADSVYAKASHGNHVPDTQTANNAIFLRNDNTWQTIKPINIGAIHLDNGFVNTRGTIQLADLDTYATRNSGTYIVRRTSDSSQLTVFRNPGASASALEFYNDFGLSELRVRTCIDTNRYSAWKVVSFSGHTHSYLPLSGGTMSGNIQMGSNAVYLDGYSTHGLKYGNKTIGSSTRTGVIVGDTTDTGNGSYLILGQDCYASKYVSLGVSGTVSSGDAKAISGETIYNYLQNKGINWTNVFEGFWYTTQQGISYGYLQLEIPRIRHNIGSNKYGTVNYNIQYTGGILTDSSYLQEYIYVRIFGSIQEYPFYIETAVSTREAYTKYSGGTYYSTSLTYINIQNTTGAILVLELNGNYLKIYSNNKSYLNIFEVSIA